jgi:hypothetical protein
MDNTKFRVKEVDQITVELLKAVIAEAHIAGHSSFAPLGCSGQTYIIHQLEGEHKSIRSSQISLRKHSGNVELLITNKQGVFLFHGKYDTELYGFEFIANEYFRMLQNVKQHIFSDYNKSKYSEADLEEMAKMAMMYKHMPYL